MNENHSQCRVYIDMTNLTLVGRSVAAVAKGLAPSITIANTYKIADFTWRLDLRALLSRLAWSGSRRATRIVAFGSSTGYEDVAFWRAVQLAGMEARIESREPGRREKGVDVSLALEAGIDAESMKPGDEITIVAGDGDYTPLVRRARERELNVRVAFWSSAAKALKEAASEFVCLDRDLSRLTLQPYTRRRAA